jgi:hypothetical protein
MERSIDWDIAAGFGYRRCSELHGCRKVNAAAQ